MNISINIDTKLIGLLGYPLAQSRSPLMHNTAFEEYSLNKIYLPIEVSSENLKTVVDGIKKMNFEGFNVTIPHKVEIIKYIDEIDEYAKAIGAVNTVTVINGVLKGYNTDGTGFLRSFEESTKQKIDGKKVFIIGAGGAARAIALTLAMNKARKIYICNRTLEKAEALSNDINKIEQDLSCSVPMLFNEIQEAINDSDVVINCTSIGMYPNSELSPIDKKLLNKRLIVCDVVYNPKKTKLICEAEKIGCEVVIGLPMFVYQGVEAFELWTGTKAPINTMLNVVENVL
ncbi:MAG: shikimate dehydrogenase [Sedimentibacter sp.]